MKQWDDYICGMTWGWTGVRGTWTTSEAVHSLDEMAKLAVNYCVLAFAGIQETPQSTTIAYLDGPTVSDDEIRFAVAHARALGLKVCLKPIVNCANGTWRAHINFFDEDVPGEPGWTEWFASYTEFIVHYARLAEELSCELFCIGCEMVQADRREAQWRSLISKVRSVYNGLLTYNCDKYQEDRVLWWDAVDVITSSGYYPHDRWERELDRIEPVVQRFAKPFFFMEAGCPSRVGSPDRPNDWTYGGAASMEAQDEYYGKMFDACDRRSWVAGFALWDWPANLYVAAGAASNRDYCPYGKLAEARIRRHYRDHVQ